MSVFCNEINPMSEFKFACPVCGQHITCDAAASGTPMDCPTCFRKLVVPQASAAESKNFVLTAAAVPNRKMHLPAQPDPATTTAPASKIPVAVMVIVLLGCVAGAGVFAFRGKLFSSTEPGNPPEPNALEQASAQPGVPVVRLPPSTNWTLNLAAVKIPEASVSGTVLGRPFTLERAVIQAGRLDLRQGPKWPPDVGVSVHLFADRSEDLAGKTVVLEATRTNAPRVILRAKDEQNKAVTRDFRKGYAARVEFGQVTNNRLAGKIYLAAPDDANSYAAGTFSAEIRKPTPPPK